MTPKIAKNIVLLIERCTITGAEVPVYMQCLSALYAIVDAEESTAKFNRAVDNRDDASGASRHVDNFQGD